MAYLTNYEKGLRAEKFVINKLIENKYCILGHRVKTPYGEIDILAQRGNTIIAIEVKLRKTLNEARECISRRQIQRILQALLLIMSQRNLSFETYRIDVVCVNKYGKYEYIKNVIETLGG